MQKLLGNDLKLDVMQAFKKTQRFFYMTEIMS